MQKFMTKLGVALAGALFMGSASAVTFTDVAGREVTIPDDKKIENILLGEGRFLHAVALLEGDKPFARIAGWQGDFKKLDPQSYEVYKAKFPEIDTIPLIGNSTPESVSSEKALTINPDVVIFGVSGHGPDIESGLVKYFEKMGVPVVFIDFRSHPLENTVPSIRALGKAIQREAEAEKYIEFYESELKKVTDITSKIPEDQKTSVFIELKAGTSDDCCSTAGNGNMGDFVDLAGGNNISKPLLPAALGKINLEKLIVADPDVYIASGSILPNKGLSGVPFGMTTTKDEARSGLESVLNRNGISTLSAIKNKRVYGLWHTYYNSPYNIIAIQNMAKWFYPDEFKDLDPNETQQRLYDQFLPVDLEGTFWIELESK